MDEECSEYSFSRVHAQGRKGFGSFGENILKSFKT